MTKNERVYSEETLDKYTVLQEIENLKNQIATLESQVTGDTYTKSETDNKFETIVNHQDDIKGVEAYITNVAYDIDKALPTDVGIKDNKLGLLHDTKWLTNQDAINLDGFTYDETTKTLKASGGSTTIIRRW